MLASNFDLNTGPNNGDTIYVDGVTSVGDGGEGWFIYLSGSTLPTDNINVFNHRFGGQWVRNGSLGAGIRFIRKLTQAEYNLLPVKDEHILFVIVE